jgi:hypothetical protein
LHHSPEQTRRTKEKRTADIKRVGPNEAVYNPPKEEAATWGGDDLVLLGDLLAHGGKARAVSAQHYGF